MSACARATESRPRSWGGVSDEEWEEMRLDVQGLTNHRTEMDIFFFFLETDFILETLGSRGSDLGRE